MKPETLYPHFIFDHYSAGETSGEIDAGILFFDIAGFTAITETLLNQGNQGVEILTDIINQIYDPVIKVVYRYGGFVASFAGDAFTAVFTDGIDSTLAATAKIQNIIEKRSKDFFKEYNLSIQAKQSLSYGILNWGVAGNRKKAFYFSGETLSNTASLQSFIEPGQIITDPATALLIKNKAVIHDVPGAEAKTVEKITVSVEEQNKNLIEYTYKAIIGDFIPEELAGINIKNEFRVIASVFIEYIGNPSAKRLDRFIVSLMDFAYEYGGYFSGLDFTDKGKIALIQFGLPRTHEDDMRRAVQFSKMITKTFGEKVRIGLTSGPAFAGIIGSTKRACYTGIGDAVNLAARLMQESGPGKISVPQDFQKKFGTGYAVRSIGKKQLKGKSKEIEIFELEDIITDSESKTETAFIEHEKQLSSACDFFNATLSDKTGGFLSIFGGPGSGKSRMAKELINQLQQTAQQQYEICLLPTDSILKKSLNPFNFFLNNYFLPTPSSNDDELKESFQKKLHEIIGLAQKNSDERKVKIACQRLNLRASCLGAIIGIFWPKSFYDKLDPQGKAENVLVALTEFFRVLTYVVHPVLLIEDAHNLDKDSLTLLNRLFSIHESRPLSIILTARISGEDDISKFVKDENYSSITLEPFTKDETGIFIEQLIAKKVSESLTGLVYEKSKGNPFYIEQFTRFLSNRGLLKEKSGQTTLESFPDDLPDTISSLLVSKIDNLPQNIRNVVKISSVIGNAVKMEVLAKVMGIEEEELEILAIRAEREKIWIKAGEQRYIFESDIFRQAAYNMHLGKELKQIHRRVAETLDGIYYNVPIYFADIAYHYKKAEDKRAKNSYYRVARFTRDTYKNHKALEFYDEILSLEVSEAERLNVDFDKAGVLETIGNWKKALALLTGGIDKAEKLELHDIQAKYAVKTGEIYQKQSDYPSAQSILLQTINQLVFSKLDKEGFKLLGDAYQWLGRTLWSLGNFNDSLLAYYKSQVYFGKSSSQHGEALSLYYIGVDYRDKGNHNKALEFYEKSLAIFEELDDKRFITYPLYDIGLLYQYKGDLDASKKSFQGVYEIYEEIGYKSGLSAALLNLAKIEEKSGKFAEAKKEYMESLVIARELGEKLAIAYTLFTLSALEYLENNCEKAVEYAKESLTLMSKIGAKGYYGYVLSYLACIYFKMGKYNMALKAALKHLRNIKDVGSDVEHGRTFYAIARTMEQVDPENPGKYVNRYMQAIYKETEFDHDPEKYFHKAIKFALKADYVNTLLPTLRHYGNFLSQKERKKEAVKFWKKALKIANEKGYLIEKQKLEKLLSS
ncbi:MAG: tetratricopeptide repeat protein [Leptospirales bacterium]